MLMGAATVVPVLQDLFYCKFYCMFYFTCDCSLRVDNVRLLSRGWNTRRCTSERVTLRGSDSPSTTASPPSPSPRPRTASLVVRGTWSAQGSGGKWWKDPWAFPPPEQRSMSSLRSRWTPCTCTNPCLPCEDLAPTHPHIATDVQKTRKPSCGWQTRAMLLKSGSWVTQQHRKWHHSIACLWFSISVLQ